MTRLKKNAVYSVIGVTRYHYWKKGQAKVLRDETIEMEYCPEDEKGAKQAKSKKKLS